MPEAAGGEGEKLTGEHIYIPIRCRVLGDAVARLAGFPAGRSTGARGAGWQVPRC